jgi:hypothetical protein
MCPPTIRGYFPNQNGGTVEEERSAPPNGRDLKIRLARVAAWLTWIFAVGWLLLGNAPLAVWVLSGRPLPAFPIIGELNNGAFYYWFSYRAFGYLILASVPLGVAEMLAARALWRGERPRPRRPAGVGTRWQTVVLPGIT